MIGDYSIGILIVLSVLYCVHAQPRIQLSLEGGDSNSGRVVVVWYGSVRGTICSDGFDNNDAAVICRILGKNAAGAVFTSRFGPGTGVVIMSRLGCQGDEQDLDRCGVGRWGANTNCQHSQDVGVICGGAGTQAPCDSSPCRNGAACINFQNSYQCECPAGFVGRNCENTVQTPCVNSQCRNGAACINLDQNTYRCDCPVGFVGQFCENTVQSSGVCSTAPCRNGGTCTPWQSSPGYYCSCTRGYSGTDCSQGRAPCVNSQCRNDAACINLDQNTYRCDCPAGFVGQFCENTVQRQPCDTGPCMNGGRCRNRGATYVCDCPAEYSGPTCTNPATLDPGQCQINPCENSAPCRLDVSQALGLRCSCPFGYSGDFCENSVGVTQRPTPGPTPRPVPTPSPGDGCRDAFLARPNRVGLNAGRFPALSITACSDACLSSYPTCYGYDWRGTCYLYLNSTNPTSLQVGTGVNYERILSCPRPAPPVISRGSCRDSFITYENQHVTDGAFVQTSSTQDCANKCLQSTLNCLGYGVWYRFWCFLVFYTHGQSDVEFDRTWTRYQRVFTCQGSG